MSEFLYRLTTGFGEGLLFSGTVATKTSVLSYINIKHDACLLL